MVCEKFHQYVIKTRAASFCFLDRSVVVVSVGLQFGSMSLSGVWCRNQERVQETTQLNSSVKLVVSGTM